MHASWRSEPGETLDGTYRLEASLGLGVVGERFDAVDVRDDTSVTVLCLHPVLFQGALALELHVAEGRAVGDAAAAGDQGQGAGNLAGFDVALAQVVVDSGKTYTRQSNFLGFDSVHAGNFSWCATGFPGAFGRDHSRWMGSFGSSRAGPIRDVQGVGITREIEPDFPEGTHLLGILSPGSWQPARGRATQRPERGSMTRQRRHPTDCKSCRGHAA